MIQHLISYFINDEDLLIWYLVHGLFTDSYCQSPCSSIVRRGSSSSYRDLPGRWRNPYFLGTEVYRNICDPPPLLATLCSGLGKPKVDIPHPTPVGPSQPLREKYHPDQWEQSRLHIRNTSMSIEEHQSQTELKTAISLLYGAFSYILPWSLDALRRRKSHRPIRPTWWWRPGTVVNSIVCNHRCIFLPKLLFYLIRWSTDFWITNFARPYTKCFVGNPVWRTDGCRKRAEYLINSLCVNGGCLSNSVCYGL